MKKVSLIVLFLTYGSFVWAQDAGQQAIINNEIDSNVACTLTNCYSGYSGSSSCAPEVKARNIDIVNETLIQLSKSPDFKNEITFQKFVLETTRLPSIEEQISAYGSILGLNRKGEAATNQAMLSFVGARDYSKYEQTAQKNLQMMPEHSSLMVKAIAKDLLMNAN